MLLDLTFLKVNWEAHTVNHHVQLHTRASFHMWFRTLALPP